VSRHHTNSRNMQKVKATFREECATEDQPDGTRGRPCWLCGMPIDYDMPDSEHAFNLDHYYPASTHPEHYEDPANFRASHAKCNQVRGNNPPRPLLGVPSRQWL
jgi:5-methylcytosine-specific restriction endonuclease McrA